MYITFTETNIYIKHDNNIFKVENYKPIGKLKELKLIFQKYI